MIVITHQGNKYAIKTDWQDVTLADYIRFNKQSRYSTQFAALNPGCEGIWKTVPDVALDTMRFLQDDPITNYLNPTGEGLPDVDGSAVGHYWACLELIKELTGTITELELGAKIYAEYFEKPEAEVLAMPVLEVYGAIAFFLKTLRDSVSDSPLSTKPSRITC